MAGTYTRTITHSDGYTYPYSHDYYLDELPITLEDLGYPVQPDDPCSYKADTERSLIASHSRYTQDPLDWGSALPYLFCEAYDTNWAWLLETSWESLVAEQRERYEPEILQRLDPAPWGALEAYHQEGIRTYLLRYPNRIVTFHLGDSEAGSQQIDRIARALRP